MTSFLPPIFLSPFGKAFTSANGDIQDSFGNQEVPQSSSGTYLEAIRLHRPRQISPASTVSLASNRYNENNARLLDPRVTPATKLPMAASDVLKTSHDIRVTDSPTPVATECKNEKKILAESDRKPDEHIHGPCMLIQSQNVSSNPASSRYAKPRLELHSKQPEQRGRTERRTLPELVQQNLVVSSHNPFQTPRNSLFSRVDQLRKNTSSSQDAYEHAQFGIHNTPALKPRTSDESSDFVHTIKTASMSNASFSVIHRSLRVGRSTESSAFPAIYARCSLDSDRPNTNSSVDEAALHRSFKRRQIIQELIQTEESYVSDLRALAYLYSTLLASAGPISDRFRSSIQRNVAGLLSTHESISQKLRRAAFQATARKWAIVRTPGPYHISRRNNIFSSEVVTNERRPITHRQTRSSVDSREMKSGHDRMGTSDPDDASDVAEIFLGAMTDLLAYEEYCANHEVITQELHKHMPQLWSAYESGIESLARTIVAIENKDDSARKGLTVGDLLVKPIQRICKYPLLFQNLLDQTPVTDSPSVHAELDLAISRLREVVQAVNVATDNHEARANIQRKWLLYDRLDLSKICLQRNEAYSLGNFHLCGILHVTYQTTERVDGSFALCVLFNEYFLVAVPSVITGNFVAVALICLQDIRLGSAMDGLQCSSALYTWKACFVEEDSLYEFIFSACSKTEEEQWTMGLQGKLQSCNDPFDFKVVMSTRTALELKSVGHIYTSRRSLSRDTSVQRTATVNTRASISQVILRNTHNAQDLQEYRATSVAAINRSQSHINAKRIPVLEPKRSDRIRMENSINDIWTKERLPYPGMKGSKGGQIIRASAGTLARKLSLASIHTPFSRVRTPSLTLSNKRSYEALNPLKPTFEVRRTTYSRSVSTNKRRDIPEVDDMQSVVGRMMAGGAIGKQAELSATVSPSQKRCETSRIRDVSHGKVGPDDPADSFYLSEDSTYYRMDHESSEGFNDSCRNPVFREKGYATGRRRKRWSNPISVLRGWGSEAKILEPER